MRQILGSKPQIGHEVPSMIERHDDHDESTQDIHGFQSWTWWRERKRLPVECAIDCRTDRCYHAALS
jgi:hypothetical protein